MKRVGSPRWSPRDPGPVEQLLVGGTERVEVATDDGRSTSGARLERRQERLHLLGPVPGIGAVLQVGRGELHADAVDRDGGDDGHAAAHAGLGRTGGEPPEPDVGEADDDRVLQCRPRHDGVAVQTALVVAAGRLGLLERITEAELDELGAERVAGAQLRGDGVGHVHVLRSGHAGVDLGEQRDVGVAGRQPRRHRGRAPPALDVPGRHARPSPTAPTAPRAGAGRPRAGRGARPAAGHGGPRRRAGPPNGPAPRWSVRPSTEPVIRAGRRQADDRAAAPGL